MDSGWAVTVLPLLHTSRTTPSPPWHDFVLFSFALMQNNRTENRCRCRRDEQTSPLVLFFFSLSRRCLPFFGLQPPPSRKPSEEQLRVSASLVEAMMMPDIDGDVGGVRAGLVLDPVRQGVSRCIASVLSASRGVFLDCCTFA